MVTGKKSSQAEKLMNGTPVYYESQLLRPKSVEWNESW